MNLVFVHGRSQGGKNPKELQEAWVEGLEKGFRGRRPSALVNIELPFYGDALDGFVEQLGARQADVLDKGSNPTDIPADPLTAAIVDQMAERSGIDKADALADLDMVEKGPERWEWVQALLRRVEERSPWIGDLAIGRFTADVKLYLSNSYVQQEINKIVLPALQRGPSVVVSHSLGTVVAYMVLVSHPELHVPLFITAGSPLGLTAIKDHLPIPLATPGDAWLNISDPADVVALHEELDSDTFLAGIDNISDIDNGDNPHSIDRYLSDERVGDRIIDALT